MIKKLLQYFTCTLLVIFLGCSSSKQSVDDEDSGNKEIYVFDEVPVENNSEKSLENSELNSEEEGYSYFVQIGAFATKNNAETLVRNASNKISEELLIIFNNKTSLYQVRIKKAFTSRNDAAILRDKIRQTDDFKDAWIVKILK